MRGARESSDGDEVERFRVVVTDAMLARDTLSVIDMTGGSLS